MLPTSLFAISIDFNSLKPKIKSSAGADAIDLYMGGIYGSDVNVDMGAISRRFRMPQQPGQPKSFDTTLMTNRKSNRIEIDFEEGISSFSFDLLVQKLSRRTGAEVIVMADGEVVYDLEFYRQGRRANYRGNFGTYEFDSPVNKLEFISVNGKPIGIDNLIVNIATPGSLPGDPSGSNVPQPAPEPSTLLLLGSGLLGILGWRSRTSR